MEITDHSDFEFPPIDTATPEGLLAVGGNLSSSQLMRAYRRGIFPWYSEGQPILWWSPDPRLVLYPEAIKISRSLRKTLKKSVFRITLDSQFKQIMVACAAKRSGDDNTGTWISEEMIDAYCNLYNKGFAHSVEIWQGQKLVGGLYGVALGGCFFGESMFSTVVDASKIALIYLTQQIQRWGFSIIDCQITTNHMLSLGAVEISRQQFLHQLQKCLKHPGRTRRWEFDKNFALAL